MENFNLVHYKLFFETPKRLILETPAWIEHIPLAFFLIEILKPKIFVELGVHTGNSFYAFCQAVVSLGLDTKCYGVDTWQGDEHSGFYNEDVFNEIFRYNIENYQDVAFLLRKTFKEALSLFSDHSIDLLHIDGLHKYEAVKGDFEDWLPKMSEQGVILFHDTQVHAREFGVWKLWEELLQTYKGYELKHGSGLGILAVGENIPEEFVRFLESAKHQSFYENFFYNLGKKNFLDFSIKKVEEELSATQKELASKKQLLSQTEKRVEELERHIASIESSLGFRIVKKCWKIRDHLLPHSSRRRKVYQWLISKIKNTHS